LHQEPDALFVGHLKNKRNRPELVARGQARLIFVIKQMQIKALPDYKDALAATSCRNDGPYSLAEASC
jgi:hypothetical protein